MSTLTVFALCARALMAAVPMHWVCVALSYAFDGEPDGAVAISGPVSVLVLLTVVPGIVLARKRPEGRARMAMGPRMVSQWRPLVLIVGSLSALGGFALHAAGSQDAAYLSIGLGATIVLFELLAIAGSTNTRDQQQDDVPDTPKPIQPPSWALPLGYWLTVGPFIVLAGSRVAVVPIALLLIVFEASEGVMAAVYWPLQIIGYGVGIGLAWVVWRQIVGYLTKHAA